jgi:hypothetical protein
MKAKLKFWLTVGLASVSGGTIFITAAAMPFVRFLTFIKEPIFLLSMFAFVGMEIATILSIGPARRKYQEEAQITRDKRKELPEPPCDLNDPDLAAAVNELNDMLPDSLFKLEDWKAEFRPPEVNHAKAIASDIERKKLAEAFFVPEGLLTLSHGEGGSTSIAIATEMLDRNYRAKARDYTEVGDWEVHLSKNPTEVECFSGVSAGRAIQTFATKHGVTPDDVEI